MFILWQQDLCGLDWNFSIAALNEAGRHHVGPFDGDLPSFHDLCMSYLML